MKTLQEQVENLINLGYPKLLNLSESEFLSRIARLEKEFNPLDQTQFFPYDLERGQLPLVVVVNANPETMMNLINKDGKQGVTILRPYTSQDFQTIPEEQIPGDIYLLINVDRGQANINLPPIEAMKLIRAANRHPFTINEGIAIVTQYPEFLMKNNCFSLLASRKENDKRVPAIWINGKKEPNLGWCWNGNPHTWLGSASAEKRI